MSKQYQGKVAPKVNGVTTKQPGLESLVGLSAPAVMSRRVLSDSHTLAYAGVARLQRTVGNQGLGRLANRVYPLIQTKLTIGVMDSVYKQNADSTTQVVQRKEGTSTTGSTVTNKPVLMHTIQQAKNIRCKCTCSNNAGLADLCEECQQKRIRLQDHLRNTLIQRACGPQGIGNITSCIGLSGPVSGHLFWFEENCDDFSIGEEGRLREFARTRANNHNIEIHGFSGENGPAGFNDSLSCLRAEKVRLVLNNAGLPPQQIQGLYKHGVVGAHLKGHISPTFMRTVVIRNRPTSTPARKVCGPNVSNEIARIWNKIRSDFTSWPFRKKEAACRYLVQPYTMERGFLELNNNAFDTLGLFGNTIGWIVKSPYYPSCSTPKDRKNRESPSDCSSTVQTGRDCWLAGTVNYGTYGVMMKLCRDWTVPLNLLGGPGIALSSAFSETALRAIVTAYKMYDHDDPGPPLKWALATYNGGPSAKPSGGNRGQCGPNCSIPFSGPSFDYVWEPSKRRNDTSFNEITKPVDYIN